MSVGQILEKADYKLDQVDDSVKGVIFGAKCRGKVKTLEIELATAGFTDEDLLALCSHFPNVDILTLKDSYQGKVAVTAEGIREAITRYPKLVELHIPSSFQTDKLLLDIAATCTMLERIELHGSSATASAITSFVGHYPNLTHLTLKNLFETDQLFQILSQNCPKLTFIELNNCDVQENQLISCIQSYPNLTHLQLPGFIAIFTDALLYALGEKCTNLRSIQLTKPEITPGGIEFLMQKCPIERICIHKGEAVSDEMLQPIAVHGRHLKEILLIRCGAITDAGICPVIQDCPLKLLSLGDCPQITDLTLETAATFRPELEQLDVMNCPSISRYGLLVVISHLPKLKYLNTLGTGIAFSEFLARELATRLPLLNTLQIETLEARAAIANPGSQLTRLIIGRSSMTDPELQLIAKNCRKLRYMSIKSANVTLAGIRFLLEHCRLLKQIYFTGMHISSPHTTVASLESEFPCRTIVLG